MVEDGPDNIKYQIEVQITCFFYFIFFYFLVVLKSREV